MGKVMGYSKDDRRARASHILLSFDAYPEGSSPDSEAMANGLKAKIEGGDFTFEFAAEKFSSCQSAERGGDLGEFKRGAMVPAFDEAVFKQGRGGRAARHDLRPGQDAVRPSLDQGGAAGRVMRRVSRDRPGAWIAFGAGEQSWLCLDAHTPHSGAARVEKAVR